MFTNSLILGKKTLCRKATFLWKLTSINGFSFSQSPSRFPSNCWKWQHKSQICKYFHKLTIFYLSCINNFLAYCSKSNFLLNKCNFSRFFVPSALSVVHVFPKQRCNRWEILNFNFLSQLFLLTMSILCLFECL
jgi:hypothetical protein